MSKIKLIASDLDGTLLQNHAQRCNSEVFPLIHRFAEKGVYFVPASGRTYPSLQKLFAPVKDEIMYLCENGALVIHTNQVLVKRQFEDSLAMRICHAVLEHPDCEVLISGERTSYLIPKSGAFVTHMRDEVRNNICIVDTPERIEEPIIKVSYFTPAAKRDGATKQFEKLFSKDACDMMVSGNEWVDFAPLGTSKGSALAAIGEALGIMPDEMVAFGDNENDRTMLNYVGHPYLMEQCNPTMKDVNAVTCKRVETSLTELLEHIG